jgi:hypothetical protein
MKKHIRLSLFSKRRFFTSNATAEVDTASYLYFSFRNNLSLQLTVSTCWLIAGKVNNVGFNNKNISSSYVDYLA